jgi:hypothetical protein
VSTMNSESEAARASWQRPDAPLGTLIFREGLLSAEQLEEALGESVKLGKRLGQVLVERGLLEEAQVARILARQKGLDYVDLRETTVDPAAASLLSSETAWHAHAVAISASDGTPVVAVEDPSDEEALTAVSQALGTQPRFAVATRSEILRLLGTLYPDAGQGAPPAPPDAVAQAPVLQPAPAPQPVVAEASGLRVAAPPQEPAPEPTPAVAEMVPEPAPVVEAVPEPEPVQVAPVLPSPEPAPVVSVQPPQEVVRAAVAPTEPAAVAVEPVPVAPLEPAVEPAPVVESAPVVEPTPVFEPTPVVEPTAVVEQQPVVAPAPEQLAEPTPATAEPQPEPFQAVETPHVVEVVPEPQFVAAAAPPAEEPPAVSPDVVVELTPQAPPVEFVAPAPEAVAPGPEPELAPQAEEPVLLPVAEPEVESGEHRVVARLSDGAEIEVGVFASHEEASGAAKLLSRQIGTAAPGEWPHLGGRFVRPDLIVSVDLV